MANQRFSNAFREALWEAHGQRCIYCSRPVAFRAMEIDHVIPESLLGDPSALHAMLQRLGVAPGFDLLGFENLAAACSPCNQDKLDRPLADGALMIKLAQVAARIPQLQAGLARMRQERDLDNTLRHIARSLEANRFTPEELLKGLDFVRRMPGGIYGASPSAPPSSPEERRGGTRIRDESRIMWTEAALDDMRALKLNAGELNDLLYRSVQAQSFDVKKLALNDDLFELRAAPEIRLIFKSEISGTTVLQVLSKRRTSLPNRR